MENGNALFSWDELQARFEESMGFEEIGCASLGDVGKPGEAYQRILAVVRLDLKCKSWDPKNSCQVDYECGYNRVKLEVEETQSLVGFGDTWSEAIKEIECDLSSDEFGSRSHKSWQKNQLVRDLKYECLCSEGK